MSKYYNIDDLRLLAKRRVPQAVFDYADGAAEDELTKKNNRDAYRKWKLIPDALIDVADVDTETQSAKSLATMAGCITVILFLQNL